MRFSLTQFRPVLVLLLMGPSQALAIPLPLLVGDSEAEPTPGYHERLERREAEQRRERIRKKRQEYRTEMKSADRDDRRKCESGQRRC